MKKNNIGFYFIIFSFFFIVLIRIFYIWIIDKDKYQTLYNSKTNLEVKGISAPRGRILDCKGKILVDNVGVNTIMYHKIKEITVKEELKIAQELANVIKVKEGSIKDLKNYYLLLNDNGKNLITKEEYKLLEERKINNEEILNLKYERITEELMNFNELDKNIAYIYSLMNKGFVYQKKEIISDISNEQIALIMEKNIVGITVEMKWKRVYLYDLVGRSIFGNIGSIPLEEKDYYLSLGYELTDIIGISYLEKEYEEVLKGQKAIYKVNNDNTLSLIKEAKKGQDLVLGIDIELQLKVEEIIKDKLLLAKKYDNTEYFKESYAIVSDPFTGEIKAMAGIRLNDDNSFSEIAINNIKTSYTIGSTVKGATIAVGYKYNLIDEKTIMNDSCIKLHLVPQKCSHKKLGKVNDLKALAMSSNYFQYQIAIKLTGNNYQPNMKLNVSEKHFQMYRDVLNNFGLGALTEIDLPGEIKGIEGSLIKDDLLLNLAIGQYDTYTPVEVLQYINSVAAKKRIALSIKKVNEVNVLNEIDLDDFYLERIRLGLNKVLLEGTGKGYVDSAFNPVGKTGTSESFYDSNNDNILDLATISSAFAGYFPFENPQYSLVVISPNVSHKNGKNDYLFMAAKRITRDISDYLMK
ncbi:MAG: hypothetical protein E7172_04670 [Firmicutes bacterium]|nr:hypothetical protein [Bacillota bacterium]